MIPTYNEEEGIEETIRTVISECSQIHSNYEILVVDDSSDDSTRYIVERLIANIKQLRIINRTGKRSLGASVGEGIQLSKGGTVIVMDSDLTHDPKHVLELLESAERNSFALGSRFSGTGRGMLSRRHYWASKSFSLLVRRALRLTSRDNLSGYFAVKKEYVLDMPHDKIFFGYGDYFFRLLYYVQIRGLELCEHSIKYSARVHGTSKSRFVVLAIEYTRALLNLKKLERK